MPLFQYKAVSPAGEVQEGVLDSASQAEVVQRLQGMGLIPIRAVEARMGAVAGSAGSPDSSAATGRQTNRALFSRKVSQGEIALLTREIATLLRAGLPLDRSLEILLSLAENPQVDQLLTAIRNEVRGGTSLSKALDQHRDVFSRFYINMVRAGEAGGALAAVLMRLAEYMERARALRESVISALVYPTILFVVAIASVLILVIFVVPQFKQIFEQSGKALPFATEIVLGVGTFVRQDWPILVAVIIGVVWILRRSLANPISRRKWDQRFLGWPVAGKLIARVEMARFSRSLGTLITNGVPLLTGLSILRETMGNKVFIEAVDKVSMELKEGRGMAKPMLETGVFPKLAVQMISVGEETGKLDEMLFQVAEVYDREVAAAVQRALALIEPVMIVGLALLIGAIIMSLLVAMFGMMELPA